jgi:hypothetical protein
MLQPIITFRVGLSLHVRHNLPATIGIIFLSYSWARQMFPYCYVFRTPHSQGILILLFFLHRLAYIIWRVSKCSLPATKQTSHLPKTFLDTRQSSYLKRLFENCPSVSCFTFHILQAIRHLISHGEFNVTVGICCFKKQGPHDFACTHCTPDSEFKVTYRKVHELHDKLWTPACYSESVHSYLM